MDIGKEVKPIIEKIDRTLISYLQEGKPEKLMKAVRHYPAAGGKRLRPLIAYLVAEAVGKAGDRSLPFGCALEIIHNFTLIHDDIIDQDPVRRGRPAVHVLFDIPTAIIAGDAMFARAFEVIGKTQVCAGDLNRLYGLTARTVWLIAEGQQMDFDFETRNDVRPEQYLEMIERKTAVLFSCASEGGAIIASGSEFQVSEMKEYGRMLGIAFQIWDDVLGITGEEEILGKPIGSDIRNGKRTLIVLHALAELEKLGDNKRREFLLASLGNEKLDGAGMANIIALLEELGSIEFAKRTAFSFAERAKHSLNCLDKSRESEILSILVDFSVGRKS